jgi:S-adenosylmethionine:tRNA ribosyltransferase-isomerase
VLHRNTGEIEHRFFRDIGEYLRPGDVLVCNESRVIPARLFARKVPSGGKVELLLIAKRGADTWEALVKGRKVVVGTRLRLESTSCKLQVASVEGEVVMETEAGGRLIRFDRAIEPLLDELGVVPLPPYVHVPLADPERYQTVYARVRGSVAAPTAGLHFTPLLIDRLQAMGVRFVFVTLHIGLDTFRPVAEENIEKHRMHREYYELNAATAKAVNAVKTEGRRVIAVGTTSVRVLETAAISNPKSQIPNLKLHSGWTDLFIYPGFKFRVVDAMVTNFHLPRSTLLMLVSAFAGKDLIEEAYAEAIRERYRFYSFGDAMLLL